MIIPKLLLILLLTMFILLVARVVGVVFKVMSFLRSGFQQPFDTQTRARHNSNYSKKTDAQSNMVKCASCDLYILDSDAISRNGMYFCSQEHASK